MTLHVSSFAGGIVLEASPEEQSTDEVQIAESFDIGPRGALVLTSEPTSYTQLVDNVAAGWTKLYAILETGSFNFSKVIAVGQGNGGFPNDYIATSFDREGVATPYPWALGGNSFTGEAATDHPITATLANGASVLGSDFAGVFATRLVGPGAAAAGVVTNQNRLYLINIGAREGTAPNLAPGLYVGMTVPPFATLNLYQIGRFDSLGTGGGGLLCVPSTYRGGEGAAVGGTKARQLYFRGIYAYNNHVFGWGYDASDEQRKTITTMSNALNGVVTTTVAHGYDTGKQVVIQGMTGAFAVLNGVSYVLTNLGANTFSVPVDTTGFGPYPGGPGAVAVVGGADGPARVMFSNLGTPLKWGNDNISATGADRLFTDSDAIVLGDAGELIRGAITWQGKLIFGTNKGLHFVAGYGRDSFITDGATPIMRSYNVVGPHAMIEGPDKVLYGVSDSGLWALGDLGATPKPIFNKLRDFKGRSNGYWDLIWTDTTRAATYPGTTNQDLVWTAVDWEREQVIVGIPWCSASNGYGYGTDTVIIKYHVRDGGFTRQQFVGVQYTAAGYFRAVSGQAKMNFLGTGTAGFSTIYRYGYKANNNSSPALAVWPPEVLLGPYSPFGNDGYGALKRLYLTLGWEYRGSGDNPAIPCTITNITNANPAVVTISSPHNLLTGQIVDISESMGTSIGMKQVLGGPYTITRISALEFSLDFVNATTFSAYGAQGVASFPLMFTCLYQIDQSDRGEPFGLSIRHAPPGQGLLPGSSLFWQTNALWLDTSSTDRNIGNSSPTATLITGTSSFLLKQRRDHTPVVITGATKANPCVITAPGHGLFSNTRISIQGVLGMTQLNNDAFNSKDYSMTLIDADHFSLNGIDSTLYGVYTSGGNVYQAWWLVPGLGPGTANRATIALPSVLTQLGSRIGFHITAATWSKRFQIEGFGMLPGLIRKNP